MIEFGSFANQKVLIAGASDFIGAHLRRPGVEGYNNFGSRLGQDRQLVSLGALEDDGTVGLSGKRR